MKKKFLSIFILFFMFFSLVSCGSHGIPGGGENGDNNVVDTSNTNKIIYNVGINYILIILVIIFLKLIIGLERIMVIFQNLIKKILIMHIIFIEFLLIN